MYSATRFKISLPRWSLPMIIRMSGSLNMAPSHRSAIDGYCDLTKCKRYFPQFFFSDETVVVIPAETDSDNSIPHFFCRKTKCKELNYTQQIQCHNIVNQKRNVASRYRVPRFPPSNRKSMPSTKAETSSAKKRIVSATSSGVPQRPARESSRILLW